jgi:Cd2+/Zn2+-exporting ATPase
MLSGDHQRTVNAIAVKLVFLVLAVLGYASLWLAIAADTGATLIVTANALRSLRVQATAGARNRRRSNK